MHSVLVKNSHRAFDESEESEPLTPRSKSGNKKTLLEGIRVSLIGTFENTRKSLSHTNYK